MGVSQCDTPISVNAKRLKNKNVLGTSGVEHFENRKSFLFNEQEIFWMFDFPYHRILFLYSPISTVRPVRRDSSAAQAMTWLSMERAISEISG